MRLRYIIVLLVIIACAGVGVYFSGPGTHRHWFNAARNAMPPAVTGFFHDHVMGPGKEHGRKRPGRSLLENNILDRLALLETADSAVSFRTLLNENAVDIHAAVPRGKPVEWVLWHLCSASSGTSYKAEDCSCPPDERGCAIRFESTVPDQPVVYLTVSWSSRYFSVTAKMAFLIKDFGFAADRKTMELLSFPEPLTFALLPSRKLSSWTAQISNEYKKEIVILQPMEPCPAPHVPVGRTLPCIMLHYPESRLRSIMSDAAGAVPNFSGFINYGGTRALEDSRVTGIFFSEIKKRHGYFIEDRTTRKSVAAQIAKKISLPFGTIGCSVDSSLETPRIEDLIRRCAIEAQKRGAMIVCGKATDPFIRALKKQLPLLRQNGVRLCYVSEIVEPDKKK
jgi:polysaccharide deacetylase 2 family uncharacterized protein YibQ